jgi:hypothetical protein
VGRYPGERDADTLAGAQTADILASIRVPGIATSFWGCNFLPASLMTVRFAPSPGIAAEGA